MMFSLKITIECLLLDCYVRRAASYGRGRASELGFLRIATEIGRATERTEGRAGIAGRAPRIGRGRGALAGVARSGRATLVAAIAATLIATAEAAIATATLVAAGVAAETAAIALTGVESTIAAIATAGESAWPLPLDVRVTCAVA